MSQATKRKNKIIDKKRDKLALGLSDEEIKKLADRVIQDFDSDKAARSKWDEEEAGLMDDWQLYKPEKTTPWEGCSNVAIPITTVTVNQFHARGYDAFFSSEELVTAKPTSNTLNEIFKETFKETKKMIAEQAMQAQQQGIPAQVPDLLQVRKMVLEETIKRSYEYTAAVSKFLSGEIRNNMTEFEEETDVMLLWLAISGTAFKKTTWSNKLGRAKSVFVPPSKCYIPYQDDREHPSHYIHLTRPNTNDIKIKIELGEYRDITKKLETPGSESENVDDFEQASQRDVPEKVVDLSELQLPRDVLEYYGYYDVDGDGIEEPIIAIVDYVSQQLLALHYRTKDFKPKGEEVMHWTKYVLIPIPGNAYGMGFGKLSKNFKAIIETLYNQTIDNITLTNCPWGFVDIDSSLSDSDKIETYPGKLNAVSSNDKPLASMVYIPRFQNINPLIMRMIDWLYNLAREVGSVSDVMTGQTNKVEAATAILAKIEQGTKVFSIIMKRIIRRASSELQKIYVLNQMHRKDYEILFWMPASFSKYFKMKFNIALNVDPSNMSKLEKLKKAEIAYNTGMQNPLIINDPTKIWHLSKLYYEAIGLSVDQMNKILGEIPPPPPEQTIEDIDQVTELFNLLKGEAMYVLPQQNHLEHIQQLDDFQKSMHWNTLDKFRKDMFEKHRREHQAYLYMNQKADKELALMEQMQEPLLREQTSKEEVVTNA